MRATFLDGEDRAAYEEEAIAHWVTQLGRALQLISPNLTQVAVAVADPPDAVLKVLARHSPLISLRLYSTVHVQAVVTFDETQPSHPKSEGPSSEEYWPALLSFYLTQSFEVTCIAAHLARPGCLIFDKAHSFIDGTPIGQAEGMFRLQIADTIADLTRTWPTLCRPDLIDVVKWFKTISVTESPKIPT